MIARFLLIASLAAPASASVSRPKDFDHFWKTTIFRLRAAPLNATLTPEPKYSDDQVSCFRATYAGYKQITVHAWYCRPAKDGKYPAVLISPWYSQGAIIPPTDFAKRGIAALWYQARGFDVDQSSYPESNSYYILDGIDMPETYVYREIVSHALRGIDFLAAQPEVDASKIAAMGASQGGGVSLLVAGLDKRVVAVAADFPFLSDWPDSLSSARNSPYRDVAQYIAGHSAGRVGVMTTLSYYDALDVADRIKVPVLVQVGMKDKTCPPEAIKNVYEKLDGRKKLKEYPNADHSDQGAGRWKTSVDFLAGILNAP